jgi:cellulose synthase/poly-beta-1,6-N-acetylglucosamine synthase-like glycosyltransferase
MVVTWLNSYRSQAAFTRSAVPTALASVIIPAHNEGQTILRCLEGLRPGIESGELEVVVVANGCSDDTADLARSFSDDITVVETEIGNKAHALNLGDDAATVFPRLYLDADVVLTSATALKIATALRDGAGEVAAPNLAVRVDGRSWAVQAYYRVWTQLPYCRQGVIGAGLYAVTEKGRSRWDRFPNLLGEDDFVRRQFSAAEHARLTDCTFVIDAPVTLGNLLKIRSRTDRGMMQLAERHPDVADSAKSGYGSSIRSLLKNPRQWFDAAVYLSIWGAARVMSRWQYRFGKNKLVWSRDNSARAAAVATVSPVATPAVAAA